MYTVEQAIKEILKADSRIHRIDGKKMEAFLCTDGVILLIQADNCVDVYEIKGEQKYKYSLTGTEEKQ